MVKTETKEEQELGVICSWMEVGASWHCLRKRQGLFCEVCSSSFSLQSLHLSFGATYRPPPFSFQGLSLLRRASALQEDGQQLEAEGLQKIESAVSGSEAEGFYGLLRGAVSYTSSSSILPPPKKHCPAPTITIS